MTIDDYTQPSGGVTLSARQAREKMLDTKHFTIASVEFVDFGDGEKPVLHVEEIDESIPLNKGNARALKEAFGSDEKKWPGRRFMLLVVDRTFEGQATKGLMLKPVEEGQK